MNTRTRLLRLTAGVLAVWLAISSCNFLNLNTTAVGETQTESQTVELGAADEANVGINMGAGVLSVAGGAAGLMEATFRYNVADWQPQVSYTVNGSQGELVVENRDVDPSIPVGDSVVNEWSLLFNNAVPIDMAINTGAGECELDLHELDLSSLRIEVGAGKTTVDLSGAWDHDLNASIHGGLGELTVQLPGEMGVRVTVDTALGSLTNSGLTQEGDAYVNEAYGSAPNTLFLTIEAGVGTVNLVAP